MGVNAVAWMDSHLVLLQDFAEDLRTLFAQADALDMGPLMQPGGSPQAAAADMASDAGVNKLLLQVCVSVLQLYALSVNMFTSNTQARLCSGQLLMFTSCHAISRQLHEGACTFDLCLNLLCICCCSTFCLHCLGHAADLMAHNIMHKSAV